jgi:cephalosporin-C deacetylase-like acetyl esterase
MMLIATSVEAWAQPAQKMIQVMVSPNHTDWKYKTGEEVKFKVQVFKNENLLEGAVIDYEIGPEWFPDKTEKGVVLKDGTITLKSSMKQPGFLRCKVYTKVNGETYSGLATAGIDVENIKPTSTEPKDFDQFWSGALADARKVPLDPKMRLIPELCTSALNFYEISFANDNPNSRIYGILSMPKKPGKYPATLEVPGAGIRPYKGAPVGDDCISLIIGIHGISVTLPQEVYNNLASGALKDYQYYNRNDKNQYYYKRVITGCAKAVDFLYTLPEFNGEDLCVLGSSQGGALSLITASLDNRIKYVASVYPALCDYAGYLNGRAGGWPHYYRKDKFKPKADEIETLAYYDVVNFARRVKVPVWMIFGFNDETCPPTSMYSAYNVITAPKELHIWQEIGHWLYPEQYKMRKDWVREKIVK